MRRADITAAARFTATCQRCGTRSEPRTAHYITLWMTRHEADHRALDDAANAPLINLGTSA